MRYLSLFSGIEAASCAWHPLGWEPFGFAEVDPFACAVLAHHFPGVPNFGDVTKFREWPDGSVDLIVGGSPCQSFSVAGLRKGMDDPRGNLILTYLGIVDRYRPKWVVYENVPGLLSSNGGKDFGALLGGLAELGFGFSYKVLDAQYTRVESHPGAVPQRRRRVFVVGCLGSWQRAAAVLLEREGLLGHPAPRREAREIASPSIGIGINGRCSVTGCGRPAEKRGWCGTHYQRWRTSGDVGSKPINIPGRPDAERFWQKVDTSGPCWAYIGSKNEKGYGIFWSGSEKRTVRAHRFAFMDQVGKIPDGLQLDHQCRNPACCNPAHLETVTPKENTQRGNAGKHWADKRASYLGNAEGGAADVPFLTRSNIGKCVNNQSPLVACGRGGDVAATLQAGMGGNGNAGNGSEMVVAVAHALTGEGFDASEDGTGRGTPLVPTYTLAIRGRGESHDLEYRSDGTANALLTPNGGRGGIGVGAIAFDTTQITSKANYSNPKPGDPCHPLVALGHPPAIAFDARQSDVIQYGEKTGPLDTNGTSMAIAFSCKDHGADAGDIAPTLRSMGHDGSHANGGGQMAVGSGMQVRRLTPLECERLQGFPDGWTDVPYRGKPASDGPRYKVIGNSMAVNCMSWLGQRIQMVEEIQDREAA